MRSLIFASLLTITLAGPIIDLPDGTIQGYVGLTATLQDFYGYEKIPYASPPIGPLRFKSPIPPEKWNDTLNTIHLDVACWSVIPTDADQSEDCLYLSVYSPVLPSETDEKVPVMLFIHGGGFENLNGLKYSWSPEFLLDHNVIVVVIQYRLGIFGFLSTQDEIIPGNYGLKDQQLAIKWTHDNIEYFGGDKEKMIIFGQSAGSASVGYQLLHEKNTGLFQGAILESGTSLTPWAFQRDSRNIAFASAGFLNESYAYSNNSQELLEFLQSVPANDLREASFFYFNKQTAENIELQQGFYYSPVVEPDHPEAFISEKMYNLLKTGNVVKVPILVGMTSEEALFDMGDTSLLRKYLQSYDEHLDWLVPHDMKIDDYETRLEIGERIRDIYTDGGKFIYNLGAGIRYMSDNGFTRSIIKFAEMYSPWSNVYFYQFSFDGELGGGNTYYPGCDYVSHGEDVNYLWYNGWSSNIDSFPEADQLVQKRFLKIWTDFARTQNPTPELSELTQNLTWPTVDVTNGDMFYVDIDEDLVIRNHPKAYTYSQWAAIYDSLGYDDFDTY